MTGAAARPRNRIAFFGRTPVLPRAGVFVLLCCAGKLEGTAVRRIGRLVAALMVAFCGAAAAQDYPARPITLVVPYAAGGGNDVMARIVAEKMSKSLGQQIVIENKGGAGGSIATR